MDFNSWQYFRAMAPLDLVIDTFILEQKERISSADSNDGHSNVWSIQFQSRFAYLIASTSQHNLHDVNHEELEIGWDSIHFLPSKRYVYKLVKRYTTRLEMEHNELEDNNLASLMCYLAQSRISNVPDPSSPCIVSYSVPLVAAENDRSPSPQQVNNDPLTIRIYPHHNDVGVAKVWEAGACLAEYIIHNSHFVRNRSVIELGAGVGLTGLVAAACGAKSMHMTDYTEATLENLEYNVCHNKDWLCNRGVVQNCISVGRLEWGYHATSNYDNQTASALKNGDVMIAADVVYAEECIPDLIHTVSEFLSLGNKMALFATTHRNRDTFRLFESELEKRKIVCDNKSQDSITYVFPCYFNQPRSDVRICTMHKASVENDRVDGGD